MSTLVSDIINEAFCDLGVIRPGETVSTTVQADAFLRLNQMWAAWGTEPDISNAQYHQSLTITAGTAAYTFGTAGTLVATAAPLKIYGARSASGVYNKTVKIVSFTQFDAEVEDPTGVLSVLAELLAVDNAYPAPNLKIFPMPDTAPGNLVLDYLGAMAAFAAVGTDISALHPAFLDALHFNLAIALMPRYGRQGFDPTVLASNAQNAKARIVNLNRSINGLEAAAPPEKK